MVGWVGGVGEVVRGGWLSVEAVFGGAVEVGREADEESELRTMIGVGSVVMVVGLERRGMLKIWQ